MINSQCTNPKPHSAHDTQYGGFGVKRCPGVPAHVDPDAVANDPDADPRLPDLEIAAMDAILGALTPLDAAARSRVLQWSIERFGRLLCTCREWTTANGNQMSRWDPACPVHGDSVQVGAGPHTGQAVQP